MALGWRVETQRWRAVFLDAHVDEYFPVVATDSIDLYVADAWTSPQPLFSGLERRLRNRVALGDTQCLAYLSLGDVPKAVEIDDAYSGAHLSSDLMRGGEHEHRRDPQRVE